VFKFNELESIHLEISNRCQASCPMCPRNIHSGIENPSLKINDWSYDDFVRIVSPEVLSQIKELNFCGSFGDPMMNNDLIRMCEYVKETAPSTIVGIHTNGSLR
jgi:MoaA/NifB/PqqE/SkfB family radical SAM enzyme